MRIRTAAVLVVAVCLAVLLTMDWGPRKPEPVQTFRTFDEIFKPNRPKAPRQTSPVVAPAPTDVLLASSSTPVRTAVPERLVAWQGESTALTGLLPLAGVARARLVEGTARREHPIAAAHDAALATGPAKLVHPWNNPSLDDTIGPNHNTPAKNGSMVCELLLFGMPHVCRIEQGEETAAECIARIGVRELQPALPWRCTRTEYWKALRRKAIAANPQPIVSAPVRARDWVYEAQVAPDAGPVPYIPPSERTFRRDIESKQCSFGMVHPITFGVPARNIVPAASRRKFFDFLPYKLRKFPPWRHVPGLYRMGHNDEYLTSLLHKHSHFAFTHKRGGWDCMRHTEILAAGSVPYFFDLPACGKYCLTHLPKDLLHEAMTLPGVNYIGTLANSRQADGEFIDMGPASPANMNYKKPGRIRWSEFDQKKYYNLADRLLNHTQLYLSTRSIVAYVLHKINYEEPKHVLVLGRDHMDYLELMMESGFADLGINYTTNFPRQTWHQVVQRQPGEEPYTSAEMEAIRTERGLKTEMHGASMVVGLRIPPLQEPSTDADIREKLKNGVFDLVVFTWPDMGLRNYPFWDDISRYMKREQLVIIDGGDDGPNNHAEWKRALLKVGHLFRRELHEGSC